ncbi:MAG: pantoate--beta-alanine ligase [Actinomycetota bacterium]
MEIVEERATIRRIVEEAKAAGRTVGLVPTMGYFHEGHLDLMRRARAECDLVVVTLFVNPTQFGEGEDLAAYPRDLERDSRMASSVGVDYIFHPGAREMYQEGFATHVEVEGLSQIMCGASREGHFRGVATVVAKLFNIVPAQRAYFGQKDAQQLVIIRKMAADLDFAVEIVAVATRREDDGLAMSSRNTYLAPDERAQAVALNQALERAQELVDGGERGADRVAAAMEEVINAYPLVNIEYIAICDNILLRPLEELSGGVLIALAARVGKARLIDNRVLEIE